MSANIAGCVFTDCTVVSDSVVESSISHSFLTAVWYVRTYGGGPFDRVKERPLSHDSLLLVILVDRFPAPFPRDPALMY